METRTLKAGTIIHLQGLPVELKADVEAETTPGNWGLIDEPLPATAKTESAAVGAQ